MQNNIDNEKAYRIALRINEYHTLLASIYEHLVDMEFESADVKVRTLVMELRFLSKSIKENDF
jgi:hypothetical protein